MFERVLEDAPSFMVAFFGLLHVVTLHGQRVQLRRVFNLVIKRCALTEKHALEHNRAARASA